MKSTRPWFVLVFLIAVASSNPPPRAIAVEPGRFLLISDIHFDPFFDGSLFDALQSAPAERWDEILRRSKPSGFNPRRADSNAALVASALDDARGRLPSPDFILYPGDFLAHDWSARYDHLAPRSRAADQTAYRDFTDKAIQFLARAFAERFPGVPVFPTLGNEDSYCGDYRIAPDGPFLAMFAEVWAPLLGPGVVADQFRETFRRGGYYSLPLPRVKGVRLVVLNTVFLSVNYDDACGAAARTPALDQFRWFEQILSDAATAGETVWLLMHVPPGINSYNSMATVPTGGAPDTFWQPELSSEFLRLLRRHRGVIRVAFAGHTHMDDYRSIKVDAEPLLFLKIAPAVSPIFGNNPAYQLHEYDRDGGTPTNFRTYFLPDLSGSKPWTLEYDFHAVYGPNRLNARGISELAASLKSNPALGTAYTTYYGVSAPPEFPTTAFEFYRCAIANVTAAEYLRSLNGVPTPSRARPDRRALLGVP